MSQHGRRQFIVVGRWRSGEQTAGAGDTKTLCEKVSKDRAQRVIDSGIFDQGDMIGYFNIDPEGDYSGARRYTHSTMYVGKVDGIGRITCHTKARFGRQYYDDPWYLHAGSYNYTLIHIASDDPPLPAATAKRMEGWWTVSYPGRTEYYKFEANGTVRYTLTKPKTKSQPISAAGSGYYFDARWHVDRHLAKDGDGG